MNFPFITGMAKHSPREPLHIPTSDREPDERPEGYLADPPLIDAVNVALLLGQPLLLTGEPGTGKTQLAYRISWELGFGEPLRFNTKSTSTARDLFYHFDTLRRFHAAYGGRESSSQNVDYIDYDALGKAILFSLPADTLKDFVNASFRHPGKQSRSVVLIDEIDKAPRDFPNDLLHEVQHFSFRIPELNNKEFVADKSRRPILILTSNSEKNLPDAFLRRCIYYHIPFPNKDQLAKIICSRVAGADTTSPLSTFQDSAIELFLQIRVVGLQKPPSTAEMINWFHTMDHWGAKQGQKVLEQPSLLKKSLSTLAKNSVDIQTLQAYIDRLLKTP